MEQPLSIQDLWCKYQQADKPKSRKMVKNDDEGCSEGGDEGS